MRWTRYGVSIVILLLICAPHLSCVQRQTILDEAPLEDEEAPHTEPLLEEQLIESPGGWSPPPDLVARARQLGAAGEHERPILLEELQQVGEEKRILVCRAGLRLRDDVLATACSRHLEWNEVDMWETRRIVDLWLRRLERDPAALNDFYQVRRMLGADDVPVVLDAIREYGLDASAASIIVELHRPSTWEQLPAFAALASPNTEVGTAAWDMCLLLIQQTNQNLEAVGRAWIGPENASASTATERDGATSNEPRDAGLPKTLRRIIAETWFQPDAAIGAAWQIRWLATSKPSAEDAEILRDAARLYRDHGMAAPGSNALYGLLRSLRFLPSDETRDLLRSFTGNLHVSRNIVLSSLAHVGVSGVLRLLAERARSDSEALALWIEVDPTAAQAYIEQQLLRGTKEEFETTLHSYLEARHYDWVDLVLDWPDPIFEGFARRAIEADLDPLRLSRIVRAIPSCRTQRVAAYILDELDGEDLTNEWTWLTNAWNDEVDSDFGPEDLVLDFAFLEAADPDRLRDRLRSWAADADPALRHVALRLLLQMGDAQSGPQLVDWVRSIPDGEWEFDDRPEVLLARSPSPEVESYLQTLGREDMRSEYGASYWALRGLAATGGLPQETARSILGGSNLSRVKENADRFVDHRQRILEGRTMEAVEEYLEHATEVPPDLWKLDTPRVRAFLDKMRNERAYGNYCNAVASLASMGDADALAECKAAFDDWRYGWIDEAHSDDPAGGLGTFGHDFDTWVPLWIEQLEASCCRKRNAERVLLDLFGKEIHWSYDSGHSHVGRVPADVWRRWWDASRDARFAWSRLSGRYEPVHDS